MFLFFHNGPSLWTTAMESWSGYPAARLLTHTEPWQHITPTFIHLLQIPPLPGPPAPIWPPPSTRSILKPAALKHGSALHPLHQLTHFQGKSLQCGSPPPPEVLIAPNPGLLQVSPQNPPVCPGYWPTVNEFTYSVSLTSVVGPIWFLFSLFSKRVLGCLQRRYVSLIYYYYNQSNWTKQKCLTSNFENLFSRCGDTLIKSTDFRIINVLHPFATSNISPAWWILIWPLKSINIYSNFHGNMSNTLRHFHPFGPAVSMPKTCLEACLVNPLHGCKDRKYF